MDAGKLKFMMSIQLEIDKLETKLGSDHHEVIELKEFFQRLSDDEIKKNHSLEVITSKSKELLPILNNTEDIIDKVNRVVIRYDIIDSEINRRASFFYKDFPENNEEQKKLKCDLVRNLELFELSKKKEDHKLASKYIIIQLEGILNWFEIDLIQFEESSPERPYSQFKYIKVHNNGSKSMSLLAKCSSIKAFKNLRFVDIKKITLVNDIRNYESHLFSNEQKNKSEDNLQILKDNPSLYYESVFNLIKLCIPEIK